MIDGLKPYSEYKDSGLAWLGQVPSHWNILRTKLLLREIESRSSTGKEQLLKVSQYTGVTQRKANEGSCGPDTRAKSLVGYKRVSINDLVVNIMLAWNGSLGISRFDGIVSPAYCVYRLGPRVNPWYFHELLRCPAYKGRIKIASRGVVDSRLRLYTNDLGCLESLIPPPDEQAAIVTFLDYANGKIERAIRAKRKLIGLFNEQKHAIIHRAVTRGLDPNVKLKPSGIPWLGDVPEHWTLKRFKYVATINTGQVDPRKPKYRNLILIAPNHIRSGDGYLIEKETAADQGADSGKYMVTSGQIIYSKIRPNLRKATIAPCNCLCSADMYPISPKTSELSTDFLLALLLSQAFTKFAVDSSMRVAMPKVNREALANCILWFPSLNEQTQILEYLGREMAPFDTAIIRTQREIDLLREYRTTLTAEVVTGKLDVRETAKGLPDQADEPLPADELLDDLVDDEIAEEVEA
jgi:type I restriction enzyme S subunit